jgi:hypothetical protein
VGGLLLATALALPPPASVAQAAHQLRLPGQARQRAALANLKKVCRGTQRHGYRDREPITKALLRMGKKASPALWRPLLDSYPCFSAKAFLPLLTRGLNHADPSVGAYAAESCVWLAYAPGAALANAAAADPLRDRVTEAVVEMTRSSHPKVREVAVETLHAAGRAEAVEPLRRLIVRERQKGEFSRPNSAAMVARFERRLRALEAARGAKR